MLSRTEPYIGLVVCVELFSYLHRTFSQFSLNFNSIQFNSIEKLLNQFIYLFGVTCKSQPYNRRYWRLRPIHNALEEITGG